MNKVNYFAYIIANKVQDNNNNNNNNSKKESLSKKI